MWGLTGRKVQTSPGRINKNAKRPYSSQFETNQTLEGMANNHYDHSKIRPYLTNSAN